MHLSKGGSFTEAAHRAGFIVDIVETARRSVGSDFPILIKMNFNDFIPGGLKPEEAVEIAKIIVRAGIDAIEVTGGISWEDSLDESAKGMAADEVYFMPYAKALKAQVSTPVILVGGIRSPGVIDRVLGSGAADFISMARPLICEPGLVRHWRDGDLGRARCISCNKCRENMTKQSLRCYLDAPEGRA